MAGASTPYQKDVEDRIAKIADEKVRDIMRAGTRGGQALHLVYLDSSIDAIVDHIVELQRKAGIPDREGPLPEGYPARFVK
jgi:hypothetical protein